MSRNVTLIFAFYSCVSEYIKIRDESGSNEKLVFFFQLESEKNVAEKEFPNEYFYLLPADVSEHFSFVLDVCSKNNFTVSAIINYLDTTEQLHGRLISHFGCIGPDFSAIKQISNKVAFAKLTQDPEFADYRPQSTIILWKNVQDFLSEASFPIVLKRAQGAKSRGVAILANLSDQKRMLQEFVQKKKSIPAISPETRILCESFVKGVQRTPIALVDQDGKVHILSVVGIQTARDEGQSHQQIVYRTLPAEDVTQKQIDAMQTILQRIADRTKLKSTFIDPEFIVSGNKVYLIEVNVRLGGFRQKLLQTAAGVNLYQMNWDLVHNSLRDAGSDTSQDFGQNTEQNNVPLLRCYQSVTSGEVWSDVSGKVSQIEFPHSENLLESLIKKSGGREYFAPPIKSEPLAVFTVVSDKNSLDIARKIRNDMKLVIE